MMSELPHEITSIFKKYANPGPAFYTWLFDPVEGEVELHDNEGHALDTPSHNDLAEKYPHPDRVHGYAYRIIGGWRITDWEDKSIEDRHVLKKVQQALSGHRTASKPQSVETDRFHYGRPLGA